MISSRTPEGWSARCDVCGQAVRLDPSHPPGDAPCPHCGSLCWFEPPDELVLLADDLDEAVSRWEFACRPPRVVVDFSEVRFLDSAYLGRLIRLHMQLTQTGGRMRIEGLSDDLRRVFDLTKLNDLFDADE